MKMETMTSFRIDNRDVNKNSVYLTSYCSPLLLTLSVRLVLKCLHVFAVLRSINQPNISKYSVILDYY